METFRLDVVRIQRIAWRIIAAIIVLDVIASVAGARELLPYALTRFFDGDEKVNVPTTAKLLLLLASTLLLVVCWAASRRRAHPGARAWALLAVCTTFAFCDEATWLHQTLSHTMEKALHTHGPLHYAWVLLYLPIAAAGGIVVIRYMRSMPPRVRRLLLPGGILYAVGALLFEPIKSEAVEEFGEGSLTMKLVAACSDSLQLVGLTLLASSVLIAAAAIARTYAVALVTEPSRREPAAGLGRAAVAERTGARSPAAP